MDVHTVANETATMDDDTRIELMDEAERLAVQTFGQGAELEHIETMFELLIWRRGQGLPDTGTTTLH